jgi:hypothetical protein
MYRCVAQILLLHNREIELQRGEIRRLREQVHLLVSQLSKGVMVVVL